MFEVGDLVITKKDLPHGSYNDVTYIPRVMCIKNPKKISKVHFCTDLAAFVYGIEGSIYDYTTPMLDSWNDRPHPTDEMNIFTEF